MKRKLALLGPWDRLIWSGRKALIAEMIAMGWDVSAIAARTPGKDYAQKITQLGATFVEVPVARFMDPITDLKYFWRIFRICRREQFDLIHTFTIKPNVFGTAAARLAGARRVVSLVEGFGYGYGEGSNILSRCVRGIFFAALRVAFFLSDKVWFLNSDDLSECEGRRLLPSGKGIMIASCGVDIESLRRETIDASKLQLLRSELGGNAETKFVVCVGRMNWPKGIREFVEASKIVGEHQPTAMFLLVGEIQAGSPFAVPREYLEASNSKNFRWLDFRHDVKELMALADVVALPTYYREGVPLVLLEALALGKPTVATNWVGCREAVIDGTNGILVPTKDTVSLANAIGRLLADAGLRSRMGAEGRRLAERQFNEKDIAKRVVAEVYELTA
jgi:N,N'-diacetylbacillosaminyl-diphospho-undecaprenol alpha-1,3-N-acetylgalactosaminyltransferase